MKVVLFIISVVFITCKSFSQNKKPGWILAGISQDGTKTFIKSTFESKSGSKIKIWYKDINEMIDSITHLYTHVLTLVEIDYASHKMRLIGAELNDLNGKLIFKHSYDDEPWET